MNDKNGIICPRNSDIVDEMFFFLIRKNFLTDICNILYIQSSYKY